MPKIENEGLIPDELVMTKILVIKNKGCFLKKLLNLEVTNFLTDQLFLDNLKRQTDQLFLDGGSIK